MVIIILIYVVILIQQQYIQVYLLNGILGYLGYYFLCSIILFIVGFLVKNEQSKKEIICVRPAKAAILRKGISIFFVCIYLLQIIIHSIYLTGYLQIRLNSTWYQMVRFSFIVEHLMSLLAGYLCCKIIIKKKGL